MSNEEPQAAIDEQKATVDTLWDLISMGRAQITRNRFKANIEAAIAIVNGEGQTVISEDAGEKINDLLIEFAEYAKAAQAETQETQRKLYEQQSCAESSIRSAQYRALGDINEARHLKNELEKLIERAEEIKRLPNAETTNAHMQASTGRFKCHLCGCSIGKMQQHAAGEWKWMEPNYCPNCGAEVKRKKVRAI
jgi:hypothetical protein